VRATFPLDAPLSAGTRVSLHASARFVAEDLVMGGAPWRLLKVSGAARDALVRWRLGDVVAPGEERLARTLVRRGLLDIRFTPVQDVTDVVVVVPVRNDSANLERLLGELDGLSVTVVDDGSRDQDTVAEICAAHGARRVRHDVSEGPGAARNAGARATDRPFMWFVDADVVLDDAHGTLGLLRASLLDPAVGAAAARVRGTAGESARERFEHRFGPLDLGARSGVVHPAGPVAYVPSACLLVRRDAFARGFDPAMLVGEDVDFIWRLIDEAWLVRYEADAVVEHPARNSWAAWWRQRMAYGRSSADLAARHGTRMAPLRADRWTLVAWAGALARAPWVSARAVAAVHASLTRQLATTSDDPSGAATALVARTVVAAGGPLARALVRSYGPVLWVATLHPRLRRRALVVLAVGTLWRFKGSRPRLGDLALGVADDLAYALGVVEGAWHARSLANLTPTVASSSITWREVLGARSRG
jgi:mycofactocin system glycosyltransferase